MRLVAIVAPVSAGGPASGNSVVLIAVASARELLGAGTLLGYPVMAVTEDGGWYLPNELMLLPPSAFFIIGLLIWAMIGRGKQGLR